MDLNKLEYISSAGLRVLLSAQKIINVQGNEIFKTDTIEFLPITGAELKERGDLQPIVVTHKTGEGENDFVNAQLEFAVRLSSEERTKITQFTDYSPAAFRAALNEYSVDDDIFIRLRFKGCDVEGYGVMPSVGISYWMGYRINGV